MILLLIVASFLYSTRQEFIGKQNTNLEQFIKIERQLKIQPVT